MIGFFVIKCINYVSFEGFIVTLQSIFYSVEDVTTFARKKLTKLNIGTCIAQNEVGGR